MTRRVSILAVALGLVLLSSLTHRIRKAHAEYADEFESVERYVDMGVVLRVVKRDPNGTIKLGELPALTEVARFSRGGIVDTANDPVRLCAPSQKPAIWYCSEAAAEVILHPDHIPARQLVYGAMGAGKTVTLAQWLYFRALEYIGENVQIGATAPTNERAGFVADAIRKFWPARWWRWKERAQTFTLPIGVTVKLVSTHRQSEAEGSRIQGYTWVACGSEEVQDCIDEDPNIEARGRGARNGHYKRLSNATAKDNPAWRAFRDRLKSLKLNDAALWEFRQMRGPDSPFIPPAYWDSQKASLTDRAYAMQVGAMDVMPEDRIYTSWDHEQNIKPVPVIGAKDVTAQELARFGGPNCSLLAGHDPGRICDVTILLKAYQYPNERDPVWFVVGEVTTERSTTETHAKVLTDFIKKRWGDHRTALVHIDPHSNGAENDDERPDMTVTKTLMSAGFHVRQAAYQVGTTAPGRIGREARLDMVNTLLCNANGLRRLFVSCDQHRQPAAKRLVEAIETIERDAAGKAERGKKGAHDMTHWPAALGYALWKIEKPRLDSGRRVG